MIFANIHLIEQKQKAVIYILVKFTDVGVIIINQFLKRTSLLSQKQTSEFRSFIGLVPYVETKMYKYKYLYSMIPLTKTY